jgi:hypothetical protein
MPHTPISYSDRPSDVRLGLSSHFEPKGRSYEITRLGSGRSASISMRFLYDETSGVHACFHITHGEDPRLNGKSQSNEILEYVT